MVARYIYTALFIMMTPFILLRLLWRSRLAPAYRGRWAERFGFFEVAQGFSGPSIWVHAVSVGETIAAVPFIRSLQQRYPGAAIVVTTTTPTGSERVKAAFGETVFHVYAPYDLPMSVNRFLTKLRPTIAVMMETELWPNILRACQQRGVSVVVANARLSEKSARGYGRFANLSAQMMRDIALVAAQHSADGERFVALVWIEIN